MENKLFTPDHTKLKFILKIECFDNCSNCYIETLNEYKVTYQQVIGLLETVKHSYMDAQKKINKKASKKKK